MVSWLLLTPLLASSLALPNKNNIWAKTDKAPVSNNYMLGEQFFKQQDGPDPGFSFHGDTEELDELPYSVVKDYGTYERRHYPAAKMVCTYDMVDTAADPLAGLEKANPWVLMQSKRSRKTPSSIMFMRLFRYISGVNQEQEEVAMTRPVVDMHKVIREDRVGNVEMQLMCFYLPSKYQDHSHPHGKDHHDHDGDHSHSDDEGHSHSHNEDHSHDTKPHSHGDDTKPHYHDESDHSHSHGDDTKPHSMRKATTVTPMEATRSPMTTTTATATGTTPSPMTRTTPTPTVTTPSPTTRTTTTPTTPSQWATPPSLPAGTLPSRLHYPWRALGSCSTTGQPWTCTCGSSVAGR